MDRIIMYIMAAGAILGGLDRILGNRFGLGKRFEEGFMLLGPTALSMAGIICVTPLIAGFLERAVVPLWSALGLDPAMLGGVLAIDMGGWQLAESLALSENVAGYAGLVVAATFGCTVTFTIPVGMGMAEKEDKPAFARGILIGLGAMPVSLVVGGLFCGLGLAEVLLQSLPVFALSLFLMFGIGKFPEKMIRGFSAAASFIRLLATAGLTAGAVFYMAGLKPVKNFTPIEEAMAVVSSIGVVLLGSLPVAELLKRALTRPFSWIGRKTGMNDSSVAGLLLGVVSPVPVIAMFKTMDRRGKIVNAAFLVCSASALAAHMAFTFGVDKGFVLPLLASKLAGGAVGAVAAFIGSGSDAGVE